MIRKTFRVGEESVDAARGTVLCRDVTIGGPGQAKTLRRGTRVDDALIATMLLQPGTILDVLSAEPGDIDQAAASLRTAQALAGPGVEYDPPHQGQCILKARHDGLLRIDQRSIIGINEPGILLVATGLDGRVVRTGDTLAVVKAAQLWVDEITVSRVLREVAALPAIRVARFQVTKAAFLAGRRIRPGNFATATHTLQAALATYGVELVAARHLPRDDVDAIGNAFQQCFAAGAELLLVAGSIALDPEDPFLQAVARLTDVSLQTGAPIEPGTMFWVAQTSHSVMFGLASCELYGRLSILDLLLPYAIARQPIDRRLLAELGYGGLLEQTFTARRSAPPHFDAR